MMLVEPIFDHILERLGDPGLVKISRFPKMLVMSDIAGLNFMGGISPMGVKKARVVNIIIACDDHMMIGGIKPSHWLGTKIEYCNPLFLYDIVLFSRVLLKRTGTDVSTP